LPSTDVAIIGLACRFPAAADPGAFWRLIREGRTTPEEVLRLTKDEEMTIGAEALSAARR